jgi:hypothetical protein
MAATRSEYCTLLKVRKKSAVRIRRILAHPESAAYRFFCCEGLGAQFGSNWLAAELLSSEPTPKSSSNTGSQMPGRWASLRFGYFPLRSQQSIRNQSEMTIHGRPINRRAGSFKIGSGVTKATTKRMTLAAGAFPMGYGVVAMGVTVPFAVPNSSGGLVGPGSSTTLPHFVS